MREGFPIVVAIREDATAEEVTGVYERIRLLIQEAGLAA
jgi:hypothetical protein